MDQRVVPVAPGRGEVDSPGRLRLPGMPALEPFGGSPGLGRTLVKTGRGSLLCFPPQSVLQAVATFNCVRKIGRVPFRAVVESIYFCVNGGGTTCSIVPVYAQQIDDSDFAQGTVSPNNPMVESVGDGGTGRRGFGVFTTFVAQNVPLGFLLPAAGLELGFELYAAGNGIGISVAMFCAEVVER